MSVPGSTPENGRRRSDVLDAIFEAVEDKPAAASTPLTQMFRAKALAQVDIPKQIDNLLPITSPKIWVAVAGIAGVIAAALIYAAGTPQIISVTAVGRAVAETGVVTVGTIDEFVLDRTAVTEGMDVRRGDLLAEGTGAEGVPTRLLAPADGTVWQILASPGQVLAVGTPVVTILPPGSDTQVLVPVSQDLAGGLQSGQTAQILGSGFAVSGTVTEVSNTPLPSDRASDLVNVTLDPADSYVTVLISTNETVTPGAQVSVQIIESESTLLSELVNVG